MTLKQFIRDMGNKKRPATAKAIAALESTVGTKLPADYRRFLTSCGGGYFGGSVKFQPRGSRRSVLVHHVSDLSDIHRVWDLARQDIFPVPDNLLAIMDDPGGSCICLGLSGREK